MPKHAESTGGTYCPLCGVFIPYGTGHACVKDDSNPRAALIAALDRLADTIDRLAKRLEERR